MCQWWYSITTYMTFIKKSLGPLSTIFFIIMYVWIILVLCKNSYHFLTTRLLKPNSIICQGYVFVQPWWTSWLVLDMLGLHIHLLSFHAAMKWFHITYQKYFTLFKRRTVYTIIFMNKPRRNKMTHCQPQNRIPIILLH